MTLYPIMMRRDIDSRISLEIETLATYTMTYPRLYTIGTLTYYFCWSPRVFIWLDSIYHSVT